MAMDFGERITRMTFIHPDLPSHIIQTSTSREGFWVSLQTYSTEANLTLTSVSKIDKETRDLIENNPSWHEKFDLVLTRTTPYAHRFDKGEWQYH